MTNLYDFLRRIQSDAGGPWGDATITEDEWVWLNQYLTNPDRELHFKGTKVPDPPGQENTYAQSFAVKGNPQEIFEMVVEAMLQNPAIAAVICSAREFYFDHCTRCAECDKALTGTTPRGTTWNFTPHKPI